MLSWSIILSWMRKVTGRKVHAGSCVYPDEEAPLGGTSSNGTTAPPIQSFFFYCASTGCLKTLPSFLNFFGHLCEIILREILEFFPAFFFLVHGFSDFLYFSLGNWGSLCK